MATKRHKLHATKPPKAPGKKQQYSANVTNMVMLFTLLCITFAVVAFMQADF